MKKAPKWLVILVVAVMAVALIWLFFQAAALKTPKAGPDDALLDQMEQSAIDFSKWKVRTIGINGKRNAIG